MATAMASDTSLFKLGMVSIVTTPSLFGNGLPLISFSQRLDLATASVIIDVSTAVLQATVRVYVDANSNLISAAINASQPVELAVVLQSVHPSTRFTYNGNFGGGPPSCGPDLFEDNPLDPASVVISHRNQDSDSPAAFNYTLQQQGLGDLLPSMQASDKWRHRQFGMIATGFGLRRVNSTTLTSSGLNTSFEVHITALANQTSSHGAWLRQLAALHDRKRPSPAVREGHVEWWQRFWDRSHVAVSSADPSQSSATARLTQQYAVTRYLQAIQTRTWVPIKFNGQMFTTNLPPETADAGPESRDWGANSWWQNTRLTYWNMPVSGDFDNLASIFEFYLQTLPFNKVRTLAYFNHTGIYYTETKTLFGAYAPRDYGINASQRTEQNLPRYLEANGYIHYDYGGNGGGTEVSHMILEHYLYTGDEAALRRYLPVVAATLDFFLHHYPNRTEDGQTMVLFPAQALETYWCATEGTGGGDTWVAPYFHGRVGDPQAQSNCVVNDHPTVAALHVLLERVLALPTTITTEDQRNDWAAMQATLPAVPLITENGFLSVSPYASYPVNGGLHNSETPELYSVHPYRYFSLGRATLGAKRSLQPALACLEHGGAIRRTCGNGQGNSGWNQGVMNAALLGQAPLAARMVLERALTAPAKGYRFQGFAPHEQDYEPSADHFANMNSALQWMLLQPADDGEGSSVVLGAWPCAWDVNFTLKAPRNTTVHGTFHAGRLAQLEVVPESRRDYVHIATCQPVSF